MSGARSLANVEEAEDSKDGDRDEVIGCIVEMKQLKRKRHRVDR